MIINRLPVMLGALAGLGFALATLPAQAATDPFLGTWVLNVAKSTSSGQQVKSETLKIEDVGGGKWKATDTSVNAQGATATSVETFAFDGKDYPATDTPAPQSGPETDAFTRVDASTIKITMKNGGKVTATITAVVSADGKTQTATVTGNGPDGKPITDIGVYDKQ